jgi:predicted nucleic acid-binding protein
VSPPFVDADVIIRLLSGDDLTKQAAARTLLDRIEAGDAAVATPVTTIADVVHVLASRSLYGLPRTEIGQLVAGLVRLPNFRVANRRDVLRALDLFATTNLDFGDAFILAAMESAGSQAVFSYDRDFDRIPGVVRREP